MTRRGGDLGSSNAGQSGIVLLACSASLLLVATVHAGGPLLSGPDGELWAWDASRAVTLNLDRGVLGAIGAPRELVQHAVDEWSGVATSTIVVRIGDSLETDIEDLTPTEFNNLIVRDDGTNPVIFDSDGSIFDAIYGPRSNVLAVAGPSLVSRDGELVKGYAMFNGGLALGAARGMFEAVVTHEIGHVLNLDHTQINGTRLGSAVPGVGGAPTEADVATMFPVLIDSASVPHPMASLHRDDEISLSSLYPSGALGALGVVRGTVFDFTGETPIQGVNVVARNTEDPFADAITAVTGQGIPTDASAEALASRGDFTLRGLTPGKPYAVGIEEIFSQFTGGSSVGPLDPPVDFDPASSPAFLEFFNGADEGGSNPPDAPLEIETVTVPSGGNLAITILFNGVLPRVQSVSPTGGPFFGEQDITVTGVNFDGALSARLDGPAFVLLDDLRDVTSGSLRVTVPAGPPPGEYRVHVTNRSGTSTASTAVYTVTEEAPSLFSFTPVMVTNDRSRLLSLIGENLLGAQQARLIHPTLPVVDLEIVDTVSATRVVVEIPAGVLPGDYEIIVTNTASDSDVAPDKLSIAELDPILTGEVEPPTARNSRSTDVRVFGENLVGTSSVELVLGESVVPLVIVSTSLGEVTVSVPGGLVPGEYTVRLTNSRSTAEGPATFKVTKSSSGGGCSVLPPGTGGGPGFPTLLVGVLLVWILRRLRAAPVTREVCAA